MILNHQPCIDTCRVKDDYKKKEKYTMPDGKVK